MYIVGFVKQNNPAIIINPKRFDELNKLYAWLACFFNNKDFQMDIPLTQDYLETSLLIEKPLQNNFAGFLVSLMISQDDVISKLNYKIIFVEGIAF